MVQISRAAFTATVLAMLTGGCADTLSTSGAGVDYNRSFADSRNALLLLNVLRAAQREPLQFSTISSVSGSVRTSASITIPFTNVIAGGPDAISPSITASIRNPQVTVSPLATREFTLGIVRPITFGTLRDLTSGSTQSETAFALAIGGVECAGGTIVMNYGDNETLDAAFRRALSSPERFQFTETPGNVFPPLRMSASEAAETLSRGVGEGRRITTIQPVGADPDGRGGKAAAQSPEDASSAADVLVHIAANPAPLLSGPDFAEVCQTRQLAATTKGSAVVVRSVQAMFQYLGELHRHNERRDQGACRRDGQEPPADGLAPFRLRRACDGLEAPITAVAATSFHDRTYYVLRDALTEPRDDTLETLSILSEFIALQTTDATVASSRPVIAITQP